jgi:glutaredoxin-like YruB-family protein
MAKVKVYSTEDCPWCKKVKAFLKENKVDFEDINVASDEKARNEMVSKSGQMGVPVTIVGSEVIVGFDEGKLKSALNIK